MPRYPYLFTRRQNCYLSILPELDDILGMMRDFRRQKNPKLHRMSNTGLFSNALFTFVISALETVHSNAQQQEQDESGCAPRDVFLLVAALLYVAQEYQVPFHTQNVAQSKLRPFPFKRLQMDWTRKQREQYKAEHNGQLWPEETFDALALINDARRFNATKNGADRRRILREYPELVMHTADVSPQHTLNDAMLNLVRRSLGIY